MNAQVSKGATSGASSAPANGQQSSLPSQTPVFSSFPSRTASTVGPSGGMATPLPFRQRDHRAISNESQRGPGAIQNGRRPSTNGRYPRKSRKRLKPQYPQDGERHVEYVLVASFDIDKGPTMEHQYPAPISGDEHMLAELMMPDGMHKWDEDWTIFFLHKDGGDQEEERQARKQQRKEAAEQRRQARAERREAAEAEGEELSESSSGSGDEDDEESSDEQGGEGPPLIYVLNLVNTKKLDNPTINRGARVRAMAICTRHPFLHIYKPLLLLALEDYYKTPEVHVLSSLYEAVNGMDLSLLPRFSFFERALLLSTDKKNLFTEKFERMIQQRMDEEQDLDPYLRSRSQQRMLVPRDTRYFDSKVTYNQIPIPIKVPSAIAPETVGDFSIIELIKTFSIPHSQSPQPFALHPHLTPNGAFTHPILVLINAILTQKRIIFLGPDRPSHQVAEAVLAACALCSGTVLRGFTRHAFPYTDLTKIDDLLNVPGFIAGVTNSIFASHLEWWDLLCDISKGRMKISSRIESAIPTDGLLSFQQLHPQYAPDSNGILGWSTPNSNDPKISDPTGDIAFMEDVQKSIAARHGEHAIRNKWRQYIIRFLRLASAFEESVYGASNLDVGAAEADAAEFGVSGHGCVWPDDLNRVRELAASAWRIEGWRNTRSYYALVQDIAATWSRQPIRQIDLGHQLDRLRLLKLPQEECGRIYVALRDAVKSYDEISQLLAATPENHASIFYVGLGLFHRERAVREATAELLERIREHEVGRHYWPQLGRFGRVALLRIQRDMMDAGVDEDGDNGGTGLTMARRTTNGRGYS